MDANNRTVTTVPGLWDNPAFWELFPVSKEKIMDELECDGVYTIDVEAETVADILKRHVGHDILSQRYSDRAGFLSHPEKYPAITVCLYPEEPDAVSALSDCAVNDCLSFMISNLFPGCDVKVYWFIDMLADYGECTIRDCEVFDFTEGNVIEDLANMTCAKCEQASGKAVDNG